ncbi:MAG: tryptophan synthase subunit alpha [Acidobacteriota bacterium]
MSLSELQRRLADERPHFSPYFVLGHPTPELSLELCRQAVAAGATMLELGLPYGDPVADGPVVARAATQALARGVTVADALGLIRRLRDETDVPVNLLVYGNLVHRRGWDRFAADAVEAGASSLLVPDAAPPEGRPLVDACRRQGLGVVHLVAPGTDEVRVRELSDSADSFLYLAGVQGVTGPRARLDDRTLAAVERLRELSPLPACVGFGLKDPEQLAAVFAAGARIAVVGSALLSIVEGHLTSVGDPVDETALLTDVTERIHLLSGAVTPTEELKPC